MIRKEKVSTNIIKNIGKEYEYPICYENLNLNDSMICTECNHVFHYKCIKLAIEKNILKCPLCRRSLRNIDINNNDNIYNNNYYRINHRNNYDNQRNLNNYNNANINNNYMNNNNNRREDNYIKKILENSIIIIVSIIAILFIIPEYVLCFFLLIFIIPLFVFYQIFLSLLFIILGIIAGLNPKFADNITFIIYKLFYFLESLFKIFIIPLYILKGFYFVQIFMVLMFLIKSIVKKGIIYLIIKIKNGIIDLIMKLIVLLFENKKLGFLFLFCFLYFFIRIKS